MTSTAHAQRFSGTWDLHFETSAFTADSGEGPYWLAGDGGVWEQLNAPFAEADSPWGRAHLVIEGVLSQPGSYGHLGAYRRELRVTRVIEVRRVASEEVPLD